MTMKNLSDKTDKCEEKPSLASKVLNGAIIIGSFVYFASMVYFGSRPVDDPKPKASTHSTIQNYKQAVHDLDSGYK